MAKVVQQYQRSVPNDGSGLVLHFSVLIDYQTATIDVDQPRCSIDAFFTCHGDHTQLKGSCEAYSKQSRYSTARYTFVSDCATCTNHFIFIGPAKTHGQARLDTFVPYRFSPCYSAYVAPYIRHESPLPDRMGDCPDMFKVNLVAVPPLLLPTATPACFFLKCLPACACRTKACKSTLTFLLLYAHVNHAMCEPALAAARSPARPAAPAPSIHMNELDLLNTLGWHQFYDPNGYVVSASLPSNCSLATWTSLGSLHTVTNLTLTGSLPYLPDSWASNSSFPSLLAMNFSVTDLGGSLPSSWPAAQLFHNSAHSALMPLNSLALFQALGDNPAASPNRIVP